MRRSGFIIGLLLLMALPSDARMPSRPQQRLDRVRHRPILIASAQDTTDATSLRGAIIEAGLRGSHQTILLKGTFYELTIQGAGEDAGLKGDLDITRGSVTIIGSADSPAIISASALGDRAFHVMPGARLTLVNVLITGSANANTLTPNFYGAEPVPSIGPTDGGTNQPEDPNGQSGGGIYNAGTLVLKNCIIRGNTSGPAAISFGPPGMEILGSGGDGGGIYNTGILLMNKCTVAENSCSAGSTGGKGGGICNLGSAILSRCVITNNFAGLGVADSAGSGSGGQGGGVWNFGTMVLEQCTIRSNTAGQGGEPPALRVAPGGPGANGGGVFNGGNLKLSFCTVSGNRGGAGGVAGKGSLGPKGPQAAGGSGGSGSGIYNSGMLKVQTCTISGNSAGSGAPGGESAHGGRGGDGGGIFNVGTLELMNSSIAENSTGTGGNGGASSGRGLPEAPGPGGDSGNGGGIFNFGTDSVCTVRNSLVAPNSLGVPGLGGFPSGTGGNAGYGPDIGGTIISGGHNLVGTTEGSAGLTNHLNGDLTGDVSAPLDPGLGPLQNNGGATETHALSPASPAVDSGKCFGTRVDQRGKHRPTNFPGSSNAVGGDASDIGAYELQRSR